MIARVTLTSLLLGLPIAFITGCALPGRPAAGPEVPRPQQILAFEPLYRQNCAGCHGANGQDGPAVNLANPEYQSWIDDVSLRGIVESGEPGSLMPAFALSKGGTLTEAQVDVLLRGMRTLWHPPSAPQGQTPPPYRPLQSGNAVAGEAVYAGACARCHGATASHPGPAGSILDPTFLALMNAQTLRTTIVAGRPDLGQPDWRHDVQGRALTDPEITNVTAWLLAQRPAYLAVQRVPPAAN